MKQTVTVLSISLILFCWEVFLIKAIAWSWVIGFRGPYGLTMRWMMFSVWWRPKWLMMGWVNLLCLFSPVPFWSKARGSLNGPMKQVAQFKPATWNQTGGRNFDSWKEQFQRIFLFLPERSSSMSLWLLLRPAPARCQSFLSWTVRTRMVAGIGGQWG